MKFLDFYTLLSLFLLFSSCSPIFINYVSISEDIKTRDESSNYNNTKELLTCQITQGHYPDKKVQNFITIIFQNQSSDTIVLDESHFLKFRTKMNIIDSVQLEKLIHQNYQKVILPEKDLRLNYTYWSNSYKGNFKNLIHILRQEEITLFIKYRIKNNSFNDSVFLRPDLERFNKF